MEGVLQPVSAESSMPQANLREQDMRSDRLRRALKTFLMNNTQQIERIRGISLVTIRYKNRHEHPKHKLESLSACQKP